MRPIFAISLVLTLILTKVLGLGLIIPPVQDGNKKKLSSLKNLETCVSYPTIKDDLVLVRIKSGDKQASQRLNLNIFDQENNRIRIKDDISGDINFMFTNLNNPERVNSDVELLQLDTRSLYEKFLGNSGSEPKQAEEATLAKKQTDATNQHLNSNKGKSFIYFCFDNVYTDRSWSFEPLDREVELYIDFKNMTTIKETNYNNFGRYFKKFKDASNTAKEKVTKVEEGILSEVTASDENQSTEFTQEDFENGIKYLKQELDDVIDTLKESEAVLAQLLEQEFKLRDANEAIYDRYTKISVVVLVCIFIFGVMQIGHQRWFLKKQKII